MNMTPANPIQIIRCLKKDMDGDLVAAYQYAERISAEARCNAFACPGDAEAYEEAAKRLRAEHAERQGRLQLWDMGYSDNY